MNPRFSIYILGWLMLLAGGFLVVPLATAVIYGENVLPFLATD